MRSDFFGQARSVSIGGVAAVGLVFASLSGCATTRSYTLPDGTTAYEVQCSLWYQCTKEASKMCPHGYRFVKGPPRLWRSLPNQNRTLGPSRLDFVCRAR